MLNCHFELRFFQVRCETTRSLARRHCDALCTLQKVCVRTKLTIRSQAIDAWRKIMFIQCLFDYLCNPFHEVSNQTIVACIRTNLQTHKHT